MPLSDVLGEEPDRLFSTAVTEQRSRAVTLNLSQPIRNGPWLDELQKVNTVTAYRTFGGEVEALNTPAIPALPLHAVTNSREWSCK